MNALEFNSLPKDTLACRLEKPGIEPPILWLVADMVYLMSHSHPDEEKEEMSSTAFISLQFTHKYVIFPLLPWGELCRWNMFAWQGHFQDVFKWGWHSEAQEPVGQPMENQKKSVRKKHQTTWKVAENVSVIMLFIVESYQHALGNLHKIRD